MLKFREALEINKKNNFENLNKSDFVFISQLGIGSFGKVYKVSLKKTKKQYALKVLSKKQLESLKLQPQFENEIKILYQCNHPKIIKLFALFEDPDYIYMLMELAKGGTLFHKLKKNKRLSEKIVKDYMLDIINAIEYLHSRNPIILHRDIKPENILICEDGLKIADFGWSNVDDETRNTFCGTPDYLSPEMILGTGHGEKLDIWTLGVLMFELLSGKAPFTPSYKIKDIRLRQKKIEDNVLAGKINFSGHNIGQNAKDVILKMLSPKENDRPTAKELKNLVFFNDGKKKNKKIIKIDSNRKIIDKQNEMILNLKTELDRKNLECIQKDQEIIILQKKINSLKSSNRNLSKSIEKRNQKKDTVLKTEFERVKYDLNKQEETVAYLFKKTKHLSTLISDFYASNISINLNITQDYILSYESTLTKIKFIFEEFIKLKSLKEKSNPTKSDNKKNDSNPFSNTNNVFKNKINPNNFSNTYNPSQTSGLEESDDFGNLRGKPHVPKTTFDRNLKKF